MKIKDFLLRNKILVPIWIAFHALLVILFVISVALHSGIQIDADLFNMLPSSTLSGAMADADKKLSDSTTRNIFVLSSSQDFQKAKQAAEQVYEKLCESDNFESLSLYSSTNAIKELENFTSPYRWALLDKETTALLSTAEGAQSFAEDALATAYSSFTVTPLSNLDSDPFLLDETNVKRDLMAIQDAGTAMSQKDGVLASKYEDRWYVLIRGTLTEKGAAIASKDNGIGDIYATCNPIESATDDVRFVYYGSPFHSHKSSNSAIREISIISSVTLSFVIIILIFIFRSPIPLFSSLVSIFVSIGTAFAATHFVFGKIHILTLVLGTSLIGSCIDYSLHYFVHWKANRLYATTEEIRSHIFKGLFLSLVSTEICYLLLIFAPFGLLKQMGVFSATGIMSSFLTVVSILPLFPLPKAEKRKIPLLNKYNTPNRVVRYKVEIIATSTIAIILALIIGINWRNLKIENDMYKLYTMKGRLKDDNELSIKVTGYNTKGWFIVSGNTEEELLQNEEVICDELKNLQGRGYLATSRFIPSIKRQDESVEAAKNLLPLAQEQMEFLGYEKQDYEKFVSKVQSDMEKRIVISDYFDSEGNIKLGDENISLLPDSIKSVTDMLWLGKIEDKYYSIVLPVTISDEQVYKKIADESGFAYYENKMEDLGHGLDKLTLQIIIIFAIAYVIIMLVLKRFYSWNQVIKIASIPVISVMLIVAIFTATGQRIEFFGLTGIILVFGLGLDYVIYMIENLRKKHIDSESDTKKIEPFAIMLSFVTTAISFGALAFSTFVPVHTLGLAIFLGLVAAFVCTLF